MIPPVANRFVAGEELDEALDHVADVNDRDVGGILNLLGEHYHERAPADEDADAYLRLIDGIAERSLEASVSVKPSQIGIDLPTNAFAENLEQIVTHAKSHDVFVWVDMEDHTTTDTTLDAVCNQAQRYPHGVGLAIQANLKRTREDLERLAEVPAGVRLVKGAYDEPESVAYQEKAVVDEMYEEYLEFLFREFDQGVAVGSHDPAMLSHAKSLHDTYGTPFEIQMLMGVREDAQYDLAEEYDVYQYAPYGPKWLQYFYRRIRERKKNALFALRAVLGI
ncbi:proline dehydrogenase family protein [Halobacterium hubeiense]|uniref:proline dehydrogenase family protein n=1 Tax=Halobacterium hubeiense TaxID=1407499 RepID=UPI003C70EC72